MSDCIQKSWKDIKLLYPNMWLCVKFIDSEDNSLGTSNVIVYFVSDSKKDAEEYADLYGWYCINTNEADSFKLSSEVMDNVVLSWNDIQSRYWNRFVCINRTEGLNGVVKFWSLVMEDANNYAFKHNLYSTITNIGGADRYVSKMLNNLRLNGVDI